MATPKRADVVSELQALRDGIEANLSTFNFFLEGKSYSGAAILAVVDTVLASARSITQARAGLTEALQNDQRVRATASPSIKTIRDMIGLMYTTDHVMLAKFAMQAKKPRTPLTTDALLLRAAKSRATRAKRRTMGKRQKAAIKGTVTGVVITPVTTPTPSGAPTIEGPEGTGES